ncbi:MAG: xanthine dehydrogenase family protein molybdopterin-binding subunit, partial [Chloroflexota bacterium]|nr:xanthine dehydrogenase family protein molybdopterin-binding subunit [Chloroflexota bacterium]
MPTTSFMGGTVRRREDPRLITGSATYVDDITLPGMAYLAVLRSPYPHARINGIDTSATVALPGVLRVVTGEEVAELIPPSEGEQEGESGPPARAPLATGKALYVGDPVAAVVAISRASAEDALETVVIDWDVLPGVGDPEKAMEPGAPQLHDYAANNVDTRREFSHGDVDTAFSEADVTIAVRITSPRLAPNPIELRGVVATYNVGGQDLTIWSSTQCAQFVRDAVCDAMKIPHTQVRVIAPEVGGGFGCKIGAYPEDVLAAYLARKLRRPIKWIETRSEAFGATVLGRSQIAYLDLAARSDGTITGLKLRLISDSGAHGAAWAAETTAGMITGCYRIPNIKTEALTVLTNKMDLGAYRGAGRPESAYYIERAMDVLAGELQMDPIEVRRKNFIPPDAFPYDLADWPVFDSGEYAQTMDTALERGKYRDMRAEQELLRGKGRIIGVGFATYVEVCGFGWETSTVRMEEDGTVTVYTGISPHGQGQETTFSQMAADILGVQPEKVNVQYGDTKLGSGFGTMGSRGTAVGGPAVYRAANAVREKMLQIAAHAMEAAPEDLELEDGAWRVKGVPDRFVSIEDVAQAAYGGSNLPEGMEPGLIAVNNFRPSEVTAPFGTHLCMVEIDRETGLVQILKFVAVDDCGAIVSPQLVQGQVHGGVAQGISQALYEEMLYGEDGALLTSSLVDYALPTANELPQYDT